MFNKKRKKKEKGGNEITKLRKIHQLILQKLFSELFEKFKDGNRPFTIPATKHFFHTVNYFTMSQMTVQLITLKHHFDE